ncbi:MAG: NAD(P)-dependent oxidoreductase, partial [Candidatus Margulisbacteria bacterium]|nr:NAD(P)-dependent oxidoreductase [Candidatus Margulisiibacteriota bacterium]
MKILVTGNNGYIGNVMCPMLLEQGFEVVGLDSNYFDDCEFEKRKTKFRQIVKDIRQVELADFQGIDAVVHLAGLSNDPIGELNPGITEVINLDASIKCAQLARQAGVRRFIFASSCSVYGIAEEGKAIDETGALNPVTAYAKSKIGTEQGVAPLADANFS